MKSTMQKNIFREKSVCPYHMCVCPSRPIPVPAPSPQIVTEAENFAKQSCQIHFKGNKDTFRVCLFVRWGT